MKDYSICDERLLTNISTQLARVGIIVPVSEIEMMAITAYDISVKAKDVILELNKGAVVFDVNNKDDNYYEIMTALVVVEIIANTRLATAQDSYEATAALSLIQKHLDIIAEKYNTKIPAPHLFAGVLAKPEAYHMLWISDIST